VSQGRTSENAWCRENCDNLPLVRSIIERIEKVLAIPYVNMEQFQVKKVLRGKRAGIHDDAELVLNGPPPPPPARCCFCLPAALDFQFICARLMVVMVVVILHVVVIIG
jgi:hypothetical protein